MSRDPDNDIPAVDYTDDNEHIADLGTLITDEEFDRELAQQMQLVRRATTPGSSSPYHRPFGKMGHLSGTTPPYIADKNHPIWATGNVEVFNGYLRLVEWANSALERFREDIHIKKAETLADLVKLGTDAEVLEYLFRGTPLEYVWSAERDAYIANTDTGRPVPKAASSTLTRRAIIHSVLATDIAQHPNWMVYEKHSEHRIEIERVVSRLFAAHADHLGHRFTATQNPVYAWQAIRMFTEKRIELPDWVIAYLGATAQALTGLSNKRAKPVGDKVEGKRARVSPEEIAIAFGFVGDDGRFSECLRDGPIYQEAMETYRHATTLMREGGLSRPPISAVAYDLGRSPAARQKHFDDVQGVIDDGSEEDDFSAEHINSERRT